MDRRGAGPNISVSWISTPEGKRGFRMTPRVYAALGGFTVAVLGLNALQRGPVDTQVFVVAVIAGSLLSVSFMGRREPVPPGGDKTTATFTSLGMSIHHGDRHHAFGWSLVRSVTRRDGSWEFRVGSAQVFAVPESAFDAKQTDALTALLGSKGLALT